MQSQGYEYQSEFAKRHRAEGREKGREEGREEGREKGRVEGREQGKALALANAVLSVLETRSLPVSPELARHIKTCTDIPALEIWLKRAVVVSQAVDILES